MNFNGKINFKDLMAGDLICWELTLVVLYNGMVLEGVATWQPTI